MWRAEDRPTIPSRIKAYWHMFYSCGAALVRHNRHTGALVHGPSQLTETSSQDLRISAGLRSHIPSRTSQRRHRDSQKRNGGTPLKYNKI
jgi:hypothetical protein